MSKPYKSKKRPAFIALIIEIVLFIVGIIIANAFERLGKPIDTTLLIVLSVVLIVALLFTLSLIRFDILREMRSGFYKGNLPLYTDKETMILHDLKDESERNE